MPRIASNRVKGLDVFRLQPVREHLEREMLANVRKHHVIDEANARRRAFNVKQDAAAGEGHWLRPLRPDRTSRSSHTPAPGTRANTSRARCPRRNAASSRSGPET